MKAHHFRRLLHIIASVEYNGTDSTRSSSQARQFSASTRTPVLSTRNATVFPDCRLYCSTYSQWQWLKYIMFCINLIILVHTRDHLIVPLTSLLIL